MRQLKITQRITSRHETSLDKYLSDISKYSPLSVEEETDLFKQIEVLNPNDKEDEEKILKIKDKIIKANLRFVVSVAKNEMVSGMQLQDLINEWNIWLAKAVDRFDYKRWFKLISYAVWWIRQAIKQYINENTSVIRHPMNQEGLRKKVQKFISLNSSSENNNNINFDINTIKFNLSNISNEFTQIFSEIQIILELVILIQIIIILKIY